MAVKDAKTITYKIEIQDTGFARVQSSAGKLSFAFEDLGKAINAISKNVEKHTEAHGRTVNVIQAEIRAVEKLRDSFAKNNDEYRSAQNRIKALNREKKALTDLSSKEIKQELTLEQQIAQLNDGRARTMNVIKQEIALRNKLRSSTVTNNEAYLKEELELQRLEQEYRDLTKTQSRVIIGNKSMVKGVGNVSSATGTASGAVVELGRTVSDSNYGFPAMANNVQQFATQMSFLVKESKGVKGAFKELGRAMTGAGGVLLLISIAISLFERLALKARESKEEIKSINEELAKSQGTIETFEVFGRILNQSKEGTAEHTLALEKLKKEGFDPLKGSLEEFLKVKRAERELDIQQKKLKDSQIEALKTEVSLTEQIKAKRKELSGKFEDILLDTPEEKSKEFFYTAEQQKAAVEAELLDLQNQYNFNRITVEGINAQIRDSFIETTKELADNPFFNLITGKKDDSKGGDDSVSRDAVATVSAIIPFDKELAQAQLDAIAEALDIEVGLIEAKEAKIQQINKTSLEEQQKNRLQTSIIEENKRQERLQTLDALAATTAAAATLFGEETKAGKAFGIATATIDTYIGANKALKDETIPNTFARIAAASSIVITGLANVKNILRVDETGQSSQGSSTSTPTIQAPDFNIVGASQQSQLAQTIAQAEQQPTRAYVVAEDVTTAQQLDRNIIQGASLG